MLKSPTLLAFAAVFAFAAAGCSAPAPATTTPSVDAPATPSTSSSEAPTVAGKPATARWSLVSSCEPVEALVAPYIKDLVAEEDNGKQDFTDEDGSAAFTLDCTWGPHDGAEDFDQIRNVAVSIEPDYEVQDTSLLDKTDGFALIKDDRVTRAGGVAYCLTTQSAAAAGYVTTVSLSDVRVTIIGGKWGNFPALDAAAAVDIAAKLLGL